MMENPQAFGAFVDNNNLYTREGGIINMNAIKIDSNTGRIIYTVNGDSRDITDTLTTDEQRTLYQMAPSYQFNSLVSSNQSAIQPYQWVLMGGSVLLTMLLILTRKGKA